MRKICAKVVPKVLSDDQKKCRKDVRVDMLERMANEPNLLESVVTCDETWIFTYDPESKRQSMQWKSPGNLMLVRCSIFSLDIFPAECSWTCSLNDAVLPTGVIG